MFGLRRGDDRSFDELYLAEWRNVVGRAQGVVRDRFRAEELAQEAFTRAFDRWPAVRRHPNPAAWVMRVVANLAIDEVRKKTPELDLTQTPGHEDRIVDSLLVKQALGVLSGKQRDAIVLRYLMGCDEAEIAQALNVNRGTVKTHLARGMARLRDEVGLDLDSEAPSA